MRKTVASHGTGTLIEDLMKFNHPKAQFLRDKYKEIFGDYSPRNSDDHKRRVELQKALGIPNFPKPNVKHFIESLREAGFSFVVYSDAEKEEAIARYGELGIEIDGAYSVGTKDRNKPETFDYMRGEMRKDNFEPVTYLVHYQGYAQAAAESWGKALLCQIAPDTIDDRIHQFEWETLTDDGMEGIIQFLKS